MTSTMKMQGMQMPGQKWSHCFTATDLADGKMSGQAAGSSSQNGFKTELNLKMVPDPGVGEMSQVVTGQRTGTCK